MSGYHAGASAAVAAKQAVFARLKQEAETGLLHPIGVHYAWPGEVGGRIIYGGGTRFQQEDEVAEPGVLRREIIACSWYVRVVKRPAVDVLETDLEAAAIGDLIGTVFHQDPQLAGPYTWLGITSGMTDYSRTGDETVSIHSYQLQVGTRLVWDT